MKNRQRIGAQPALHDHEAHLANGGVAQSFFDVVLGEHHGGAQNRCQETDGKNHVESGRAKIVERRQAGQKKAPGVDDARMQQGMHGGRRVEGIR